MGRKRGVQFRVRPSVPSASPSPGQLVAVHMEVQGARELARHLAAMLLDAANRIGSETDATSLVERIHAAAAAWDGVDPASHQLLSLMAIVERAAKDTGPLDPVSVSVWAAAKAGYRVENTSIAHWTSAINAWRAGPRRGRPKSGAATPLGALAALLRAMGENTSIDALEKLHDRHMRKPT